MANKMYNSLSMPVHLELLVDADKVCLKTWSEITEEEYNKDHAHDTYDGAERSLTQAEGTAYMAFPGATTGIYHNKMPAGRCKGPKITGESFLDNMPESIKADHTGHLTGKYFELRSYSWIDPTDPSISGGEKSDAACWVIGVGYTSDEGNNHSFPAFNSLAYSTSSKAHPMRESRHNGAPVALMMYHSFADDNYTDASYTMKYNKAYGFSTNMSGWEKASDYNYLTELASSLPSISITSGGGSIDADGYDTVGFDVVDSGGNKLSSNGDIYLEHTGGYLPMNRVATTNGSGSFKVGALGMTSGDSFKVKVGFRNYSGLVDVNYTVA